MKSLLACVVLALKSFFQAVVIKCSSLHPKRPKGRQRCVKPVAGKRLMAQNNGTSMYLSASVRVFVYSKIVDINPLPKAMSQVEHFVKAMLYFIWHSLKGFALLKEIEIILSGISFFIFTFWLQKFLEAIFYCMDFLLDFQETIQVAFFIYSQWLNNHI